MLIYLVNLNVTSNRLLSMHVSQFLQKIPHEMRKTDIENKKLIRNSLLINQNYNKCFLINHNDTNNPFGSDVWLHISDQNEMVRVSGQHE